MNWFSDIDVYRSGDTYTGISGPLYLVGINLFCVGLVNIGLTLAKSANLKFLKNLNEVTLGKLQMGFGFGSMYMLILVNSVYFSSQFGLNILSKKSEIGALVAMIATVLICVGGYLSYRKKFEGEIENVVEAEAVVRNAVPVAAAVERPIVQQEAPIETSRPIQIVTPTVNLQTTTAQAETEEAHGQAYGGALRTGKTDYERNKAYESLKKMMLKDTLTPEQRRKEREKTFKENAFSSNFGKSEKVGVSAAPAKPKPITGIDDLLRQGKMKKEAEAVEAAPAKKTQMYRMDL